MVGHLYRRVHLTLIFQKQIREFAFTEPLVTFQKESENRGKGASPKSPTAATVSLVECPKCNIQYPATEHRDLLVHVEYCSKQQCDCSLFLCQKIQYCILCQLMDILNCLFHLTSETACLPLRLQHSSELLCLFLFFCLLYILGHCEYMRPQHFALLKYLMKKRQFRLLLVGQICYTNKQIFYVFRIFKKSGRQFNQGSLLLLFFFNPSTS